MKYIKFKYIEKNSETTPWLKYFNTGVKGA
jgi:hypothetical protein